MQKILFLIAILFLCKITNAFENELNSFCKRPGTNELFIGGDFKTIMVMDLNSGKSIKSFTIDAEVKDMQFSVNGENLLITTLQEVLIINPDNGNINKRLKMHSPRIYENSPYFADGDWMFKNSVSIYSTTDGSEIFSYTPGFNIGNIGFNVDFTELIVLSTKVDLENEESLIKEKIKNEGGYNPIVSKLEKEQSDNKGSSLHVINLQTKEKVINTLIPYSFWLSEIKNISKYDGNIYLNSNEMFIKISSDGTAKPILLEKVNSSSNSFSSNSNHQFIVGSTWNSGFIYNCKSKINILFNKESKFNLTNTVDIFIDKNKIYFLSAEYFITEIDFEGQLKNQIDISNSAGKGFGLYCHIGYTDIEKRNAQISILNKIAKSHMEKEIAKSNEGNFEPVVIGNFNDVKGVKKLIDKLKSNDFKGELKIIPNE